jgi:hypothetical protein
MLLANPADSTAAPVQLASQCTQTPVSGACRPSAQSKVCSSFSAPMTSFLLADSGHRSFRSFFKPVALRLIADRLDRVLPRKKLEQAGKSGNWAGEAGKPVRDVV